MALPDPSSPDGDAPVTALSRGRLSDVLSDTLTSLQSLRLPLATDGVDEARRLRDRLTDQLRDQVLPRLADADAPAVVVVGGSTGAGKSTLVNSILGSEVSEAGILRPTTRTPVLVANPEDAPALAEHPVAQVCRTVASDVVPAGLSLVDASDLDSVHAGNRRLAARLLEAADLWLFVTTAARYGDHTPWASLEEAARRGTPTGVVLNRVPDASLKVVRRDLLERLEGLGLADAPFFVVPDVGPNEGLLPAERVAELRAWLRALAGRHRAAGLLSRTGRGVWTTMRADLTALADAVDAQTDAAAALDASLTALPEQRLVALREDLDTGRLGEGAPSTRWVSLASSGGPLASLAQGERLRRGLLGRTEKARTGALAAVAEEARACLTARLDAAVVTLATEADRLRAAATSPETDAAPADAARADDAPTPGDAAPTSTGEPGTAPAAAVDETAARRAVAAWADAVTALPALAQPPAGLSSDAARDLVLAAAVGVDGTRAAVSRLGLDEPLADARTGLDATIDRALADAVESPAAADVARTAGEPAAPAEDAALTAPDPSLAAALRLRAGELTPLTRPGAAA
ncbi:GTPase domain-containing protein [Actinomyces radicidentis]|uniref:GTPase domain-containing protein n=1 Tax=Actinomyces radicidentis TaxID=111015 RepID=UPI0028EE1CFC|nr:GTPase domain-containing protein [Actinomyces radicidentis]